MNNLYFHQKPSPVVEYDDIMYPSAIPFVLVHLACIAAFWTGDADLTSLGVNTIMQAYVSGAQIRIVGALQPVVDYWIVARNSTNVALADLADKRWAIASVGGMVEVLPKMAMLKNGVDPSNAQFRSVGGLAARYQALASGAVDATILDTFLAVRGEAEGRLKLVRAITADFPKMGYNFTAVMVPSLSNLSKRKALEIFIRENIRGSRYIVDHPKEAADVLEKRLKAGDVADLTKVLNQLARLGVWGINGGLDRDVIEFSEKTYRDNKDITAPVPYDKIVDTSLVDDSLKALGKR